MPVRNTSPVRSRNPNCAIVAGTFAYDAGNAPTLLEGRQFSVARTGTGVYTVTLNEWGLALYSKQVSMQKTAAGDIQVEFGDIDLSAGTVIIRTVLSSTGAAANPPAADANNTISFTLEFRNTSVS